MGLLASPLYCRPNPISHSVAPNLNNLLLAGVTSREIEKQSRQKQSIEFSELNFRESSESIEFVDTILELLKMKLLKIVFYYIFYRLLAIQFFVILKVKITKIYLLTTFWRFCRINSEKLRWRNSE